jgi:N-acetylglucosamine-6-sulfatase
VPAPSAVERPNLLVILIDDLRFDEFGAGGHPYMLTPHVDRLAHEGAMCLNAFHTTPLCSPNRASIVTGQYASRHGIIDKAAELSPGAAAAGLRDRARGQVAHGQ